MSVLSTVRSEPDIQYQVVGIVSDSSIKRIYPTLRIVPDIRNESKKGEGRHKNRPDVLGTTLFADRVIDVSRP